MTGLRPRLTPQPSPVAEFFFAGLRVALGMVFIWAAYDKLLHPADFAKIVYDYQILPDGLINIVALLLPWLEVAAGLALVFNLLTRGAALVVLYLLIAFFAALAYNYSRGLNVACGCFSTKAQPASILLELGRDVALLLVAALVTRDVYKRTRA